MSLITPTFNLGDRPRATGTLNTTDGDPVDSTDVYFWTLNPAKTKTIYRYGIAAGLIKVSDGVYYFDIDANLKGDWYYGFYSTGTAQAASDDGRFRVRGSART